MHKTNKTLNTLHEEFQKLKKKKKNQYKILYHSNNRIWDGVCE